MDITENEFLRTHGKEQRNDLLKLIAMVTMFIDHLGYLFFPEMTILRTIGRIAFPIFAYQIAIGFKKTSNRKNYAMRLLSFGCIAQIPYIWFNPYLAFRPAYFNIMLTFFVALLLLSFVEQAGKSWKAFYIKRNAETSKNAVIYTFLAIVTALLPEIILFKLHVALEYGSTGVLFVLLFYWFSESFWLMLVGYAGLSFLGAYYHAARSLYYETGDSIWICLGKYKMLWEHHVYYGGTLTKLSGHFFQSRSIIAVPLIGIGNLITSKGLFQIKLNRSFAYWFYPGHIALLLLIKFFISQ